MRGSRFDKKQFLLNSPGLTCEAEQSCLQFFQSYSKQFLLNSPGLTCEAEQSCLQFFQSYSVRSY